MISFTKKHRYLVCIDSDGTIMDTMTIKHELAFGPQFIETFGIKDHQEDILHEWNRLNLYSITRGINRFQGLVSIIQYVKKYHYQFDGFDEFATWVNETKELSNQSLENQLHQVKENQCMALALAWSINVNRAIEKIPLTSAFNGVKEILDQIKDEVDLLGVSSANEKAVKEEWTRLNLIDNFAFVACQNYGSKKEIIRQALLNGYNKEDVVMLGDALGDKKAAEDNNVHFFPIIPTKEEGCWQNFAEIGIKKLINGCFDEKYQNELNNQFYDCLK
jgi:phosphoglycolate phosphatase-like HAD superfamily hydrolase